MSTYNMILYRNESTVVTEYVSESKRSDAFQSEAVLEQELIHMLTAQGYEYHTIHNENGLIANLRRQLELLNSHTFTESAWKRFCRKPLPMPMRALWKKPELYRLTMQRYCAEMTERQKISNLLTKRIYITTACRSSTNMKKAKAATIHGMMSLFW